MTLSRIFVPFFTEMLLLNMMGTINTLMLSHYSDNAVAAVGSATQLLGMILTFYTVIGTGASIVINHNLGAENTEKASDAALTSIILCGSLFSAPASPWPPSPCWALCIWRDRYWIMRSHISGSRCSFPFSRQ